MMKLLLSVIFFFPSFTSFAQERIDSLNSRSCSYYGEEISTGYIAFKSESEAKSIIQDIINVIGLKPRFEIRSASIPNAAAVIHRNKRYVLYNPSFVTSLNKSAGSQWASVSILAHEIGHHLNGHTLDQNGSRPDIELEADEFSGFVLRKLGASLSDAQVAMRIAADVKSSHTHPGRSQRLEAIKRGWETADEQMKETPSAQTNRKIEKPEIVEKPEVQEVIADKFIAYSVHFKADTKGKYYVTIRNNLIKVEDEKLVIIGRLAQSNKPGFPYMFHDKYYNYLYINSKGLVVNGDGKGVGTMKKHRQS